MNRGTDFYKNFILQQIAKEDGPIRIMTLMDNPELSSDEIQPMLARLHKMLAERVLTKSSSGFIELIRKSPPKEQYVVDDHTAHTINTPERG